MYAYEILSVTWHETKRRRQKAARLTKFSS